MPEAMKGWIEIQHPGGTVDPHTLPNEGMEVWVATGIGEGHRIERRSLREIDLEPEVPANVVHTVAYCWDDPYSTREPLGGGEVTHWMAWTSGDSIPSPPGG